MDSNQITRQNQKKKKGKSSSSSATPVRSPVEVQESIPDHEPPRIAPGVRFMPSDYELIEYYLAPRVRNQQPRTNAVKQVNLYRYHPRDLIEKYKWSGEYAWYFFTPRNRKYPNGDRPSRSANQGYWKATGKDDEIKDLDGKSIGFKIPLVFHEGEQPNGIKTKWMMHEYRIPESYQTASLISTLLDTWVLCRLYNKDTEIFMSGEEPDFSCTGDELTEEPSCSTYELTEEPKEKASLQCDTSAHPQVKENTHLNRSIPQISRVLQVQDADTNINHIDKKSFKVMKTSAQSARVPPCKRQTPSQFNQTQIRANPKSIVPMGHHMQPRPTHPVTCNPQYKLKQRVFNGGTTTPTTVFTPNTRSTSLAPPPLYSQPMSFYPPPCHYQPMSYDPSPQLLGHPSIQPTQQPCNDNLMEEQITSMDYFTHSGYYSLPSQAPGHCPLNVQPIRYMTPEEQGNGFDSSMVQPPLDHLSLRNQGNMEGLSDAESMLLPNPNGMSNYQDGMESTDDYLDIANFTDDKFMDIDDILNGCAKDQSNGGSN